MEGHESGTLEMELGSPTVGTHAGVHGDGARSGLGRKAPRTTLYCAAYALRAPAWPTTACEPEQRLLIMNRTAKTGVSRSL